MGICPICRVGDEKWRPLQVAVHGGVRIVCTATRRDLHDRDAGKIVARLLREVSARG